MKPEKSFAKGRPAKRKDFKRSNKKNKVNRIMLNPTRGGGRFW